MTLSEYLDKVVKGPNRQWRCWKLSRKLGVSEHTVMKWANGQRGIRDPMKRRIETVTGGKVTIRDMMGE